MATLETIRKVTIRGTTEGVAQATAELNRLAEAQGNVAVVSDRAAKASLDVSKQYEAMRRSLDMTYRAAQDFESAQKKIALAQQQGIGTLAEHNHLLKLAEERYRRTAAASGDFNKSTGLARHELINLSRQIQDIGVSLASGQNPLIVGVQQLTQVGDIFAASKGSISGFWSQLTAGAAAFFTPVNTAIVGVGALTAAVAALALQWDKLQKGAERSLIGSGQRTGTTVGDIERFASQNSSSTGLSNFQARELGQDLTKTGDIVIDRLHGMGEAVVGFATLADKSFGEARKAMVAFAADPAKAIEELTKTYGGFDIETRKAVDALVQAGDKTAAFQVIVDALAKSNRDAADSIGFLETQFRRVVNFFATPVTKASGLEDQLAGAQSRLAEAQSGPFQGALGQANIARIRTEIEQLQAAIAKVDSEKVAAALRNISTEADASVRSLTPQIDQIQKLEIVIAQLERTKTAGTTSRFGGDADTAALTAANNQLQALQQSQAEAARYAQQVAIISQRWGQVGQATALALQAQQNMLPVAMAVTGAQRMAAQYAADYANAINAGKTATEAAAIASMNLATSTAAATASVLQQVEALRDQNAMLRARANGTEAQTAASIAYKNAIASGADSTAAAALKSETLKNFMLQAAGAAGTFGVNLQLAANAIDDAAMSASAAGMIIGGNSGSYSPYTSTTSTYNTGVPWQGSMSGNTWAVHAVAPTTQQLINGAMLGGPQSALSMLSGLNYQSPGAQFGFSSLGTQADITGAVDQLFQLMMLQAGDNSGAKLSVYQQQLAYLQSQPQTIDVMIKIAQLTNSMNDLKNATDANTSALNASLNPLYNGRGALAIGYYKAATGLEGIVGGHGATDSTPVHMMLTPGEHIKVTPPGQANNDNSRSVFNTNNFVFASPASRNRRSARQFAQGFQQVMAAVS